MTVRDPKLRLQTGPYLHGSMTTPTIMRDVTLAALPLVVASAWLFGLSALLVITASVVGAVFTERLFSGKKKCTLKDGSALLTGILLGLTLPPGIPLWMAVLGGIAGIGLGKMVSGGLGQNLFNPALVGRAFLQAAFPITLTTWTPPHTGSWFTLGTQTLAPPLMRIPGVDVVTGATPLGLQKFGGEVTNAFSLFTGNVGGSLGETSALLIILGGLYMLWRRSFDWRIPTSILLTVALFSGILHAISPDVHPSAQFMLLSGGLLFGAVFMATDPVSSPTSPRGAWIYGAGIGILVVLIRRYGGLPEGVMYSILLMNAASPLIERWTQSRIFGRGKKVATP